MFQKEKADCLPKADLSQLLPLSLSDVALSFVSSQRGRAEKQQALKVITEILGAPLAEQAFQDAIACEQIEEIDGAFIGKSLGAPNGKHTRADFGGGWRLGEQNLALRAVSDEGVYAAFHGVRKSPDLGAAALRQVYCLTGLRPFPSRAEVRCAFLQRVVSALGSKYSAIGERPMKAFKFDPLSRSLYLIFAGLEGGTVMQADAVLLRSAFGASSSSELAASIIRLAIKAREEVANENEEAFSLEIFAQSIRKLAGKLETKPYAGRVAIAQVYDAGLVEGLGLGSLDEFKLHVAEAAREGLLDLERYDIAGPFDANLKERSRLRFGRDERHFIVNQWI